MFNLLIRLYIAVLVCVLLISVYSVCLLSFIYTVIYATNGTRHRNQWHTWNKCTKYLFYFRILNETLLPVSLLPAEGSHARSAAPLCVTPGDFLPLSSVVQC